MIAISLVAAVAVVLAPLLATGSLRGDEQFLAVVAPAALVFPLFGVARLLPWAVAVLAGSVLVASEHGDVGSVGIVFCAGLTRIDRRLAGRLVLRLAAETVVAGALAAAVLASASLGIPAGLGPLALGLLATVSLLALVAGLVARR